MKEEKESERITITGKLFGASREGNLMKIFLKKNNEKYIGILVEERYALKILEENTLNAEVSLVLENKHQILFDDLSKDVVNKMIKIKRQIK